MAEAIVRIWWFGGSFQKMIGAGHGSLEIHGALEIDDMYITMLAQEISSPFTKVMAAPEIGLTWGLKNDKRTFGTSKKKKEPDEIYRIPIRDGGPHYFGLDAKRIEEWWKSIVPLIKTEPMYRMISKSYNCDSYVVRALIAGGAEEICPRTFAQHNLIYQGAATLKRWVKDLRNKTYQLNATIKDAKITLAKIIFGNDPTYQNIWTMEEWKQQSKVLIGRRKEQVAEIDKLMPDFQQTNDNSEKITLANQMLNLALDHLAKKPKSDRRKAVLTLAAQLHYWLINQANGGRRSFG